MEPNIIVLDADEWDEMLATMASPPKPTQAILDGYALMQKLYGSSTGDSGSEG